MKVRRVVTGVDASGKSVVLSDGPAPCSYDFRYLPGQAHTRLWWAGGGATAEPPAQEPTTDAGPILPEPGGASFMILQIAPDSAVTDPRFDGAKAGEEIATSLPDMAAILEPDNPGMHRTATVDYGIVLDGEIYIELDDDAGTALRAGDVVVQIANRHALRNRTDRPATIAFVLVGLAT